MYIPYIIDIKSRVVREIGKYTIYIIDIKRLASSSKRDRHAYIPYRHQETSGESDRYQET